MIPIFVRPERVWPKLSSIQGIRANLVYILSLLSISHQQRFTTFISNTNKNTKNENALPPGESENNNDFLSTSFQHHCLFTVV